MGKMVNAYIMEVTIHHRSRGRFRAGKLPLCRKPVTIAAQLVITATRDFTKCLRLNN